MRADSAGFAAIVSNRCTVLTSLFFIGQNDRMKIRPHSSVQSRIETLDTFARPLHDLRISVLDQCNFRCPYCMPEAEFNADYQFLKKRERLTHDEIFRLARIAVSLGVSKLRLTGGEPLLDKRLPDLVRRLATIANVEDLALTTNGMLLEPVAQKLADAGLHRVTVSLDSLDADVFRRMNGNRGDVSTVLAGIAAAEAAGLGPIKINAVVQRNINDQTILPLLEHFRGTGHIVRLIEYMDVGNRNGWHPEQVVPSQELLKNIQTRWPLRAVGRQYAGEVARRYQYLDGAGEIGFISSVTEPFCGACSRARLSAEGVLYTCLFANTGISLRDPMRNGANDDELAAILRRVWNLREDRYSELRRPIRDEQPLINKVEMYRIGG
jgi:cyclic pyranopterin phosphate synthase